MDLQEIYSELLARIPQLSSAQKVKASQRAAQAFEFLTQGYQTDWQTLAQQSLYDCPHAGQVMVKNIEFISLCEHHLLPIIGTCHVAYQPQDKVLGLGKISEIVAMFSHRLQLQERLTRDIADAILSLTQAKGVMVAIEARHLCMVMQGVEKSKQEVVTTCALGSMQGLEIGVFR